MLRYLNWFCVFIRDLTKYMRNSRAYRLTPLMRPPTKGTQELHKTDTFCVSLLEPFGFRMFIFYDKYRLVGFKAVSGMFSHTEHLSSHTLCRRFIKVCKDLAILSWHTTISRVGTTCRVVKFHFVVLEQITVTVLREYNFSSSVPYYHRFLVRT